MEGEMGRGFGSGSLAAGRRGKLGRAWGRVHVESNASPDVQRTGVGAYSFFFFLNFIYLFIYFWLCWVFVSVRGLSLVAASGGHSFITVRGPLAIAASLVAEHRLQTRRLSNCGSRASLLRGTWDLPRPGLKPVSPALAGRFSTTAPPGKPWSLLL